MKTMTTGYHPGAGQGKVQPVPCPSNPASAVAGDGGGATTGSGYLSG